jgi:hypothetical protein
VIGHAWPREVAVPTDALALLGPALAALDEPLALEPAVADGGAAAIRVDPPTARRLLDLVVAYNERNPGRGATLFLEAALRNTLAWRAT